jgi:hypothetical protein
MHSYLHKKFYSCKNGCYTTTLGRNVYNRISHLESAHAVWKNLCNTFEGTSKIKSTYKDT